MIQLNYRDSRPIYEQVKDGFRHLIIQKVMTKDEKLPSVRELATSLTINPNTIQRAYRELEQEGYVYTIPGKGSFAAGVPETELLESFDKTVKELKFLGMSPEELMERIRNVSK